MGTHLSSPNVSIGDMVLIKTGFPIKHFGNDHKVECYTFRIVEIRVFNSDRFADFTKYASDAHVPKSCL